MILRRNQLPHTAADIGCFLLMFTFVPITFVFELAIVLPEFHGRGSVFYNFAWIAGIFLVFNIKGNMIACMLVDTSINTMMLQPPSDVVARKFWRYCSDCEVLAPPRSWHCQTCGSCILRRDHHCFFTGCCVGHRNYRYFLFFVVYIFIGSAYTTVYNSIYFWWLHGDKFFSALTCLKMIFPMLMFTVDTSWSNFYLLIYELNVIALAYSIVLILYHTPRLLRGNVAYEARSTKYDLGWRRNLEMVLGRRMWWVALSPFVKSDLPHDGVHWEDVILQSAKNR